MVPERRGNNGLMTFEHKNICSTWRMVGSSFHLGFQDLQVQSDDNIHYCLNSSNHEVRENEPLTQSMAHDN